MRAPILLALALLGCSEEPEVRKPPAPPAPRPSLVVGDGSEGFADSPAPRFFKPIRLAPYGEDAVLVADIGNHAIRIVRRDGTVKTLAGGPDKEGHADGPVAEARFRSPHGVAVSEEGVIAVSEAAGHTIRMLIPNEGEGETTYRVVTWAGRPGKSGFRDGPVEQALFHSPHAVAWTADGALIVADIGNARIRRIGGGNVSTVAGTGETGNRDGRPGDATFTYPMDLTVDRDGSILVVDAGAGVLRRIVPGRSVNTLRIDGGRKLKTPHGICVGPDAAYVIAEMDAQRVIKIDLQGRLRVLFGVGVAGPEPERLNRPAAVLVHAGLLWIADLDNNQVKALPYRPD